MIVEFYTSTGKFKPTGENVKVNSMVEAFLTVTHKFPGGNIKMVEDDCDGYEKEVRFTLKGRNVAFIRFEAGDEDKM